MKKHDDFSADVKSWLEFADYDLKTANWELKGKIYTSCCYACQQAAEKALKALILTKGKVIPKVHSLDRLISELKNIGVKISKIEKDTQNLDKYYISTRYPGQYGGPLAAPSSLAVPFRSFTRRRGLRPRFRQRRTGMFRARDFCSAPPSVYSVESVSSLSPRPTYTIWS